MDFVKITALLILLVFILSCNLNEKTILHQEFDKEGRLVSEKVEGYDCCEGFYTKTLTYDTLGNIIEVFGNVDGGRMKEVYKYTSSHLVFSGYYSIYRDSLDTDFDVDLTNIDYFTETEYYQNEQKKHYKSLDFHNWNNRDTASLTIRKYDSLGNILVHTVFSKERDYSRNEQTRELEPTYPQYTIFEDRIKNQIDTIAIDTLIMGEMTRQRLNEL